MLLHYPLSTILILTLYTTAGWYVCYFVRSSDIPTRSVGRSVSPVAFSFVVLNFGQSPVEDRGTLSERRSLWLSHVRPSWCSFFGQSPDTAMDSCYTGVSRARQRNYLSYSLPFFLHSSLLLQLIIYSFHYHWSSSKSLLKVGH